MSKPEKWDLIIESNHSVWSLNLKDTWQYRDLLWMLVKRDFISFYKQTVLGPLWFFIQPLFTTAVYMFVFGNLANIGTEGIPGVLFYMAGITSWNYFSECVTKTSTVFKDNAHIFGKVYFPRLIMPLSIVVSNLVRFAVQFILFILLIAYYAISKTYFDMNWVVFLFPFLIVLMGFLGLGLGLIITALTTKYRDLSFLVSFGIQLFMYATPVIYPLSGAPEKYRIWIELNPMTGIIETIRYAFLGKGTFSFELLAISTSFTFIVLFLGILIFNRTEKNFVDTI